mmetsp:Transcript_9702/g.23513  ORF Transcript_9702/g.23513 Transcript_9702/m.23513 type:complete len:83 (-) Transcript_9702:525-773(-)
MRDPAAIESGIATCGSNTKRVPGRYTVARTCIAAPNASSPPIMKKGLIALDGIARGMEFPNNPKAETGKMYANERSTYIPFA